MTWLMALLAHRLAAPIAAGLAALLALLLGVQTVRLAGAIHARRHAEVHARFVDGQLNTCHSNVADLQGAVARQNEAVQALGKASAARVAASAREASAARARAEALRRRGIRVLAAKPTGPDLCQSADALILEHTP